MNLVYINLREKMYIKTQKFQQKTKPYIRPLLPTYPLSRVSHISDTCGERWKRREGCQERKRKKEQRMTKKRKEK